MSLTQYLKYQEDQNMTRLLNFLEFKRGKEREFFVCHEMKEIEGLIVMVEKI